MPFPMLNISEDDAISDDQILNLNVSGFLWELGEHKVRIWPDQLVRLLPTLRDDHGSLRSDLFRKRSTKHYYGVLPHLILLKNQASG